MCRYLEFGPCMMHLAILMAWYELTCTKELLTLVLFAQLRTIEGQKGLSQLAFLCLMKQSLQPPRVSEFNQGKWPD